MLKKKKKKSGVLGEAKTLNHTGLLRPPENSTHLLHICSVAISALPRRIVILNGDSLYQQEEFISSQ